MNLSYHATPDKSYLPSQASGHSCPQALESRAALRQDIVGNLLHRSSNQNLEATESSSIGKFSRFVPVEAAREKVSEPLTQAKQEQLKLSSPKDRSEQSALLSPEDRLETLSEEEQCVRDRLEFEIEQIQRNSYYEIGKKLVPLREGKLYRSTHETFDDYCQDTFGIGSRHGDNFIQFFTVTNNLREIRMIHSQNQLDEIDPTNLEQTKALGKLKTPEEQWRVWNKAVEATKGKVPSGAIVGKIVAQHKPENEAQPKNKRQEPDRDNCKVGYTFILAGLKGEEKKYNGCAATVTDVTELANSIATVDVYDATIVVKLENLNKIASSDDQSQLLQTLKRIRRIRDKGESLEPTVASFLKGISKQTNVSSLEEDILSCIEKHYSVTESESKL